MLKKEDNISRQSSSESVQIHQEAVLAPPKLNGWHSALEGVWWRPLLLILLAHTVFSLGIWNARDGYGEDTDNVLIAFQVIQSHHPTSSIYIDLIALVLKFLTSDPVTALTFVKYLSSLLATVALYFALSSFSKHLRKSAIIFACLVWIASSLDAPILQSTSLSLFTFAIMLFGIDCLLFSESIAGLFGFYFFGIMAALLRPEYFLPVVLLTFILMVWTFWSGSKTLKNRFGWSRFWTLGGVLCVALAGGLALWRNPPAPVLKELNGLDQYALLGLGQCYADFYHREHPDQIFSPMTEYRDILDRKFNKPDGFFAAIRNNPLEILRYFTLNARHNFLHSAPNALLGNYRESEEHHRGGYVWWLVRIIIIAGGLAGVARLCRINWKHKFSFDSIPSSVGQNSTGHKLFLLLLLLSTSSVAILLLVGTPRYYLCCVPLFYLGVAFCADSLLRAFNLFRYENLLVALSLVCLCAPNYLVPRPNYEFDAVRHVAPYVKDYPTVGAWWADPDTVLALYGKAKSMSIWDGIHQADIENGKIDILLIDANFRETKTWADQRDFFEHFERDPEMFGFKKANGISTGRFDIYYKPRLNGNQ